jgi:hypothetical protein
MNDPDRARSALRAVAGQCLVHHLAIEAGDEDDLADTAFGEGFDLPLDNPPAGDAEKGLWLIFGQGQQALTLPGSQYHGLHGGLLTAGDSITTPTRCCGAIPWLEMAFSMVTVNH